MTEDVDELLFDDDNNTAENEEAIETEEDKIKRLRGELEKCLNGSDLYNYCIVHLPITGMKFGVSLSMNRAIAYLKNSKIIDDKTPTWANCKKNHKEIISSKFDEFLENSATFKVLRNAILEGFVTKKMVAKKNVHETLLLDEVDEIALVQQGGRSVDRTALLACALADPSFIPMFTELAAPIEAPLRPAFLDLGAAQMTAARWNVVAEAVNRKANSYENDFASLKVGTHGYVLADIDPKKGSFVETPSLSMGKQFQQLLTKMRNQLMLLNQRVFKSGDNSGEDELIESAYIRTGKFILRHRFV
jgi:hypothetical protein